MSNVRNVKLYVKFIQLIKEVKSFSELNSSGFSTYLKEFNIWQDENIVNYNFALFLKLTLKEILPKNIESNNIFHFYEIIISPEGNINLLAKLEFSFISVKLTKNLLWIVKIYDLYYDVEFQVQNNEISRIKTALLAYEIKKLLKI